MEPRAPKKKAIKKREAKAAEKSKENGSKKPEPPADGPSRGKMYEDLEEGDNNQWKFCFSRTLFRW